MSDVDLSWMNIPGPDGVTFAQKYASSNQPDLSWMNIPDENGLTFVQKYERGLLNPNTNKVLSPEEQIAWAEMNEILRRYGITSISERLKKYIIDNGVEDKTRLRLFIYDQPEFKERFPALEVLQSKNRAISPEQYIELEKQYLGVMRSAGLNGDFFDDPTDFSALISNEVTPDEFRTRIENGYNKVANTNPLVREAFKNYFGLQGDQALASFFIDPEKAAPALLKAAAAAEIGAVAYAQNMEIDLNYATKLAERGVTYQQAMEGMQRITQLSGLFDARVGETNVSVAPTSRSSLAGVFGSSKDDELSPAIMPPDWQEGDPLPNQSAKTAVSDDTTKMNERTQQGIDYIFGTDIEVQKQLELRLKQRKAQASGVTQQNISNRQGQTGVGSAD